MNIMQRVTHSVFLNVQNDVFYIRMLRDRNERPSLARRDPLQCNLITHHEAQISGRSVIESGAYHGNTHTIEARR